MVNGVIYFNKGTKCVERMGVSLHSLRKVYSGPVLIINEGEIPPELQLYADTMKAEILDLPDVKRPPLVSKVSILQFAEFDNNVFLDADTLVHEDISQLFEWCASSGLVFTNFCDWFTQGKTIQKRILQWSDLTPELIRPALEYGTAINTGVFAFKKHHPFLEYWERMTPMGAKKKLFIPDELCAQLLIPHFEHYLAPKEWNNSVRYGKVEGSKITHYHGNKHNGRYEACKIWRAELEELKKEVPAQDKIQEAPKEAIGTRVQRKIDILTTAVPRGSVEQAITNMFEHVDFQEAEVNWIVHLDWSEVLAPHHERTLEQINRLKVKFSNTQVVIADKRRGQARSLKTCFEKSQNDCILWEDDKIAGRKTTLDRIYGHGCDFVGFASRRRRIGNLSPGLYKKAVIQYILENWKEEMDEGDIEYDLCNMLGPTKFARASEWLSIKDAGLEINAELGIQRVREKAGTSVEYGKADARVTFVTAVDKKYLEKLKRNYGSWRSMLNMDSYPLIVFYSEVTEDEVRRVVSSEKATFIQWGVEADSQREKMLSAFVFGAAEHVKTPFWAKLDADVHAGKQEGRCLTLLEDDWYEQDVVGHRWGFTRPKGGHWPKHWLNTLDEWWESRTGEKPLFPQLEPGARFSHKRISSFLCFHRTEKVKELAEMCGGKLPVPSHDTVLWYVAHRLGWKMKRANMKAKGLKP